MDATSNHPLFQPLFGSIDDGLYNLLTTQGRLLALVTLAPEMTLREMASLLNVTESNVQAQMTKLVRSGLVSRTNRGRNYIYQVNDFEVRNHPDIQHMRAIVERQTPPPPT